MRRALSGRGSSAEDDDLVRHLECLGLVVADHHRRDPRPPQDIPEPRSQGSADLGVQGGEGLVEQQDPGLRRQGAGERDALLLAAAQLPREAIRDVGQFDQVEQISDTRVRVSRKRKHPGPELDVVGDGHVFEESVPLEDDADAPLSRGEVGDVSPAQIDSARGRILEPTHQPQERGFSRPGGPNEGSELVGRDLEVKARGADEGLAAGAEGVVALVELLDADPHAVLGDEDLVWIRAGVLVGVVAWDRRRRGRRREVVGAELGLGWLSFFFFFVEVDEVEFFSSLSSSFVSS